MFKKVTTLFFCLFFLAGCNSPLLQTPVTTPTSEKPAVDQVNQKDKTKPETFKDLEDLKTFLANNKAQTATPMMAQDASIAFSVPADGRMMKSNAAPSPESAGGAPSYSQTNNQVAGVDEADIVKTDGKYIFFARGQEVEVIKSFPAKELKLITKIEQPGVIDGLFIYNDKLVVYGSNSTWQPPVDQASSTPNAVSGSTGTDMPAGKIAGIMPPIFNNTQYSFLRVYNLEDITKPKQIAEYSLEGGTFGARLIGQYVYLITTKYQYDELGNDPLPRVYQNGTQVGTTKFPNVYHFDMPYQSYTFTSVNAFDLDSIDLTPTREIYLLGGYENLYVSEKNLYITYTKYLDEQEMIAKKIKTLVWPQLTPTDQANIKKIEELPTDILSDYEKFSKINTIVTRYTNKLPASEQSKLEVDVKLAIVSDHPQLADELVTTEIHRIALNGIEVKHEAQGEVPGQLLNQFSLDERDGNLRLATTRPESWSRLLSTEQNKSSNNLYVLDKSLKNIGSLEGLAPTEKIYAARFINDRAYLVTFVQTDPLFVIDLKDPTTPKLLGELKIPGYSNYIHPIGDNILLGIGKDTETNQYGNVIPTSIKLAIFDVNNPSEPKELSNLSLGGRGSDSAALYDHLAFLFDQKKELLAIPVSLYKKTTKDYSYGDLEFNGTLVLNTKDGQLTEKGRVSHNNSNLETPNNFDYTKSVRRNIIINDDLFSISDTRLKVNSLEDMSEVNRLDFKPIQVNYPTLYRGVAPAAIQ